MDEKLVELIRYAFGANEDVMHEGLDLRDLEGWDSMAHMFFVTRLEKEYAVELTGDEIATMQTIGDILTVLRNRSAL